MEEGGRETHDLEAGEGSDSEFDEQEITILPTQQRVFGSPSNQEASERVLNQGLQLSLRRWHHGLKSLQNRITAAIATTSAAFVPNFPAVSRIAT